MEPLGLIAGLGDLPVQVYQAAKDDGRTVHVIRIAGFEEPALADAGGDTVGAGEIGKLLKSLKTAGCREVVFAGIVKRPAFDKLRLDMRGARLLPKVLTAAKRGDDALLRVIVDMLDDEGFEVRGADEMTASLLAPAGLIGGPAPGEQDMADLSKAAKVAATMGDLDIGQGCIVCDGLVLAVEAQEGTDQMLKRCATLPVEVRGTPDRRRGVLVKRAKPGQDRRIDLPTTGVSTIEGVAAAGLSGLAVEAGGALMLDRQSMIRRADELGIFIFGFDPDNET